MINLLSIDTTLFTLWGYQMSYLEFFGTILNLWCVYWTAKRKIACWPIGIVAVVLFMILFYQIQLYSDMIEQAYFLFTGFYGWWMWSSLANKKKKDAKKVKIGYQTLKTNLIYLAIIIAGTIGLGYFMSNIHLYVPQYFTVPASYPYLDAFTTVMSFAAMIIMAKKKIECWYLWILVDIIGINLYFVKDVKFIALEYLIFLILATKGLISWRREYKKAQQGKGESGESKKMDLKEAIR